MKRIYLLLSLISVCGLGFAQQIPRFNPDTVLTVTIDSAITVSSTRLTVESFINEIINDTSFYEAFRNMKKYSFTAENRIFTYDKKNSVEGKIYRKIYHNNEGPYKMQFLEKKDEGNVYKRNGKYSLYTVEMFDYIFMNAYNSDFVPSAPVTGAKGESNESYKDKLKTLIFSPGRPIKGVHLSGRKQKYLRPI